MTLLTSPFGAPISRPPPVQAFPEAADEQHDKDASHLAAADRPPPTSSKISPLLMLKRGAQNGDCDMIRDAVDGGADINHRETGEDGACTNMRLPHVLLMSGCASSFSLLLSHACSHFPPPLLSRTMFGVVTRF
jgi:hypothetical protein